MRMQRFVHMVSVCYISLISWCAPLQAVADIIRTTLGPRSMLKMLLDPNGGACSLDAAATSQIVPPPFNICCRCACTVRTGYGCSCGVPTAGRPCGALVLSSAGRSATTAGHPPPRAGIVLTNDGHAILREIDVNHPAAKV